MTRPLVAFVLSCAVGGAVVAGGCASFRNTGGPSESGPDAQGGSSSGSGGTIDAGGSDGGHDATGSSSGSGGSSSGGGDSGGVDASADVGGDASSSGSDGSSAEASGLDPGLVLPGPDGGPCDDPGSITVCTGSEVCRISSTTGGTCEGCTNCGNLHDPCTADIDCDILFQCYLGYCDGFCQLSTPQECGAPSDCTNVGNSTTGICKYP